MLLSANWGNLQWSWLKNAVWIFEYKVSIALSPGHTVPNWRSRSLRFGKSWKTAWSAHEVVKTSYWHLGNPRGRERIGSGREASATILNCKTLSCWSWLQPRSGTRSDQEWRGRVHDRENRRPVVPSVCAVEDSVWVVVDSVWLVVKIADDYNHGNLSDLHLAHVIKSTTYVYQVMCVCLYVCLINMWICPLTEDDNTLLTKMSQCYNRGKWKYKSK